MLTLAQQIGICIYGLTVLVAVIGGAFIDNYQPRRINRRK